MDIKIAQQVTITELVLENQKLKQERDEAREQIEVCRGIIDRTLIARNSALSDLTDLERERDEARELLRILVGLVAYGLGQSGEEWSLDAMRQATSAIQNAKSLEESK
jgi:hypothetical protein